MVLGVVFVLAIVLYIIKKCANKIFLCIGAFFEMKQNTWQLKQKLWIKFGIFFAIF